MQKVKTSELIDAALDWAVARCEGATEEWRSDAPFLWDGVPCIRMDGHDVNYRPSTSWLLAGPIIERENISVGYQPSAPDHSKWYATNRAEAYGISDTPLIAAMRCYVASKLGDITEVPQELLGV